ncbi:MAG: carboxylesterase family protein [Eubacteriales bacterium]|nr:carboxylesterase family protein [Eubacteriales bacterium]
MKIKRFARTLTAVGMTAAILSASPAYAADSMNPPTTQVAQGQLRGYMDGDTYAFLGVPYASVPERFALPEDPQAWEGVRDAQAYGAICPIPEQTSVGDDEMVWPHRYWIQNEECQFLNIWSQDIDSTAKKPVIVFMHGGGFNNGSSIEGVAYEGKNLSEYGDVVVVTLNHRLNVLGYLDLSAYGGEFENSVNLGDEDLIQAVKWINENIENFGGDPENITIMGQSGGGRKVQSFMHYDKAEGLVDKIISQSSSGYSLVDKEISTAVAEKTLENLGLDENSVAEIKTVPYSDLITAGVDALAAVKEETGTSVSWAPVENEGVVSEEYCDWAADIPLMVGSTLTEQTGSFRVGDGRKNEWTDEEVLANVTEKYGDKAEEIIAEFAKAYPDKKAADAFFYGASHRENSKKILNGKEEAGTAPVYSYMFSYEAPVNGGTTAFHCVDLIYAFHNVDIPVVSRACGGDEDAHRIQDQVASAIVSFASTGDPSTDSLEWKPYTAAEPNTMRFDIESKCGIIEDDTLGELCLAE